MFTIFKVSQDLRVMFAIIKVSHEIFEKGMASSELNLRHNVIAFKSKAYELSS